LLGLRQQVWVTRPFINGEILTSGMEFDLFVDANSLVETLTIQEGTIGIIEKENGFGVNISVIRDDCKAARKAIRMGQK